MEESNKIVVKVKYQGLKNELESDSQPKMVTEWHIQRILAAIAILIVFIALPFYYFSGQPEVLVDKAGSELNSTEQTVVKQNMRSIEPKVKPADIAVSKQPAIVAIEPPERIKKEVIKEDTANKNSDKETIIPEQTKYPNILNSPKIVRTILTTDLKDKEPVDNISSVLTVNKDRATKVYYFTEIIDMKGQVLYHRWLRNGQLIFKREINILGNRWRASTSKMITYSKAGLWNVRLENEQGDILNEIQFEVIKQ
jgi:hypothetical protein